MFLLKKIYLSKRNFRFMDAKMIKKSQSKTYSIIYYADSYSHYVNGTSRKCKTVILKPIVYARGIYRDSGNI